MKSLGNFEMSEIEVHFHKNELGRQFQQLSMHGELKLCSENVFESKRTRASRSASTLLVCELDLEIFFWKERFDVITR